MMLYESRAHYAEFDRSIEQKWVQNTLGKGEKKKKKILEFSKLADWNQSSFSQTDLRLEKTALEYF